LDLLIKVTLGSTASLS